MFLDLEKTLGVQLLEDAKLQLIFCSLVFNICISGNEYFEYVLF